jgi:predicted nucleic acid-binding protein
MAYLFDSNTFLRLAEKEHPQRLVVLNAVRKLRASGERIVFTPQILAEFWNVCKRPATARGGLELSVEQVNQKAGLIQKYFELLPDSLATFNEWRRLVFDLKVTGVKDHDAKIAASMLVHAIPNLVTFNVLDFRRFPVISAIDPNDV